MLYIIPFFQALVYLASIPVCVAFCVTSEGGLRSGAAAGTFNARSTLRRARARMLRAKKRRFRAKPPVKRLIKLLARLRLERVSLKGRLGLSDAAATALACGALTALGASLKGRAKALEVDVVPAFDGPQLALRGMIRARAGQIMIAAVRSKFSILGGLPHGKAPD